MRENKLMFGVVLAMSVACAVVLALVLSSSAVRAEEVADGHEHYLRYECTTVLGDYAASPQIWDFDYIHSTDPVYGYIGEAPNADIYIDGTYGIYLYGICEYDTGLYWPNAATGTLTRTHCDTGYEEVELAANGIYFAYDSRANTIERLASTEYGYVISCDTYDTNIPIFKNKEAFITYLETGDDSGQVNKVTPDYSLQHDFASDVYSADIPIPELSNVNYNGFVVDNIGEYYLDILIETRFYGVSHVQYKATGNQWTVSANPYWMYANHFYNLSSDVLDVACNEAVIDISSMYDVDIVADYVQDFEAWSVEYPTVNKLPDYLWTKKGIAQETYAERHIYKADSELTDIEQIGASGQAEIRYYVRFYDAVGTNGQWAYFAYRGGSGNPDTGMIDSGTLVSGTVTTTDDGDIYVKDATYMEVGSSGSVTKYPDTGYIGIDDMTVDMGMDGFMDALSKFGKSTSGVADFVNNIFGFLPWWASALLGMSVSAVVLLRFLGR